MTLRDPREVERAVDDLRARMQATLADTVAPEADRRDAVNRMAGEVSALEIQARELREHELDAARAVVGANRTQSDPDSNAEHVEAFNRFVRAGEIHNAALLTTPDANGGFLMPDPLREQVIDMVRAVNPILELATVFNLTKPGTFKIDLPRKATATVGGWVAETAARPETDAPTLAQQTLEAYEWYANPMVTQSFLDAVTGAEQFVVDDIAATIAATIGTAFVAGNGSGQPSGLFAATSFYQTRLSATVNSLDAAQILGLYFALPAKYLPNARFLGNGATFAALSGLAFPGLNNTPLVRWEGDVPTIMGKPVVLTDSAPAIGDGLFPLAFGDVSRGYAVGVHSNLSVLRDPYSNKPFVGFYSTGRVGGVPWDPRAIILAKSDDA